MDTPVKPFGYHVLIKVIPVKFKSAGGILLHSKEELQRENSGRDIGRIIAFGPTAYLGFEGCKCPADWGVKVGDIVDLSGRYDGKETAAKDYDEKYSGYRYVLDSDIVGGLGDEMVALLDEDK